MKWTFYRMLVITVTVAMVTNSCKKEYSYEGSPVGNRPPVACAGADLMIAMPVNQVVLNGSCSTDPDNNISGYQWSKISGPSSFTVVTADAAQTPVLNLTPGTYFFELKVTDAGGLFSKDTVTVTVNNMPVDVYIAGEEDGRAKYWKNGQPVLLGSSPQSIATAITVVGNDVYVAGYEKDALGNARKAKYWKNGQEVLLSSATSSKANDIKVVGNDVYVAGQENTEAIYWKNGQPVQVTNGSLNGEAFSVAVAGTDVYLAGVDYRVNVTWPGQYWKNGQAIPLVDGSDVSSIAIAGSDVYVAGSTIGFGLGSEAKYWKNGQSVMLVNGPSYSHGYSIHIAGGDVYIAGYESLDATYWKNNQPVRLSYGTLNAEARSITTFGNDVYVAGNVYTVNNPVGEAYYWKNGQEIPLTNGINASHAYSICVVPR